MQLCGEVHGPTIEEVQALCFLLGDRERNALLLGVIRDDPVPDPDQQSDLDVMIRPVIWGELVHELIRIGVGRLFVVLPIKTTSKSERGSRNSEQVQGARRKNKCA